MKMHIRQIAAEVYGGCNFKCPMCPQAEGRESSFKKKFPLNVFKKMIDEAVEYGLEVVSLQGSGEPFLRKDVHEYVEYVKKKNLKCITLTNGFHMTPELSRRILDAGIDSVRISATGYDRESYKKWMSSDSFDLVRQNTLSIKKIRDELGLKTDLHFYHLITDNNNIQKELKLYWDNWINYCDIPAEVWLMHNWGGTYSEIPYTRDMSTKKRSCGRPFSPYITVRAGGNEGRTGAVVPCCYVLGRDSEAVLGHIENQSLKEILNGDLYKDLRKKHKEDNFDQISYCKDCDQLYDNPDTLVWTNIPGKEYGQSKYIKDLDFRSFKNNG